MFTRARIAAASAGTGLLLAGYVAGSTLGRVPAFAQTAEADTPAAEQVAQVPPQPSPERPAGPRDGGQGRGGWHRGPKDPQQRQQMREQFINRLAQRLNVSPQTLIQALRDTRIDAVRDAANAGRITQEQAQRIIDRINSGQRQRPGRPANP